ncbi:universal stress protein [Tenacibaculum sp. IB213877]|uniref:universal stress protein n=1 Tax=Tenacibaculum sp. IB213877 TaxID=3097351 RepID=UPI002A5A02A4|nr:universal stress protein [Tenacibaculum sp. IB213877]MDY0780858.1 universal stress protein [Tenacibaculum sp. IB213877]
MKKILIPIDFSPSAENACKLASKIARKNNSEIHILHAVEIPTGVIDLSLGNSFSIPESMFYIRKLRDRMLEYKKEFFSKNPIVIHSIRFQTPFDGIQSYSKKISANLIVMGSKGHNKLDEILIGSNTEKIVRNSDIPVLVVKKEEKEFKPKNIIFASSFKEGKDHAFKKLLSFSKDFKSKIHLLKVNTPQKFENTYECKRRIHNFIKKHNIENYSINIYNDSSVENGILNFANEIDADIIALGTHSRSGLSHIFNGSITKYLSKQTTKPILTFRV